MGCVKLQILDEYYKIPDLKVRYKGKELTLKSCSESSCSGLINMNGRMYDPVISRMLSPDKFVQDEFNAQSYNKYSYVLNNPLKYTDPSGWSFSEFDKDGNYLRTVKDNWWHNTFVGRKGRIVDDEGTIIQKFNFADPKNDVASLKDGTVNKINFVQESEIISMLSYAGAFDYENKTANNGFSSRYDYIKREGEAYGKFDFSATGISYTYSHLDVSKTLFLVDGVAHNRMNYGNFLFGAGGRALGFSELELRMGAHYNSLANPDKNGYRRQLDSRDDQFSIKMGVRHANQYGYKNMYYRIEVGPLIRIK